MHAFAGLGFYPLGMLPVSGTTYDKSLTIAGTSDITQSNGLGSDRALTIDCTATFTGSGGAPVAASLTLAVTSEFFGYYLPHKYSFTAKTGTFNCQPGNIKLATKNDYRSVDYVALLIQANDAVTPSTSGSSYHAVSTVAGFSAIVSPGGVNYPRTLTIAGFSAIVSPGGVLYTKTLSVAGFSAFASIDGLGYPKSLTIAGFASITESAGFPSPASLTIAGIAAMTEATSASWGPTLIVAGFAAVAGLGGIDWYIQKELSSASDFSALPGWGYFPDPVTIDGVSDLAAVNIREQNLLLSIDGIADIAQSCEYVAGAILTIAGFSAADTSTLIDAVQFLVVAGRSEINVENVWNTLYDTNVFSNFSATLALFANKSQEPAAQASLSVDAQGVFNRTVLQTLALEHFATYKRPTGVAGQTLTLTQVATVLRTHSEVVTQTLALTQDAQGFRGLSQTLALSQTVTVKKVKNLSVVQTLSLSQSASRNTVIHRTVTQTIVFNQPRQVTLPITGSTGGGDQTQAQFNQSLINVVLVPRKCLVILGTPAKTIILPCPVFGDSQAYTGELNLKKTMTGDTFTYVKKTTTEKLKYAFNLGTYKAIELREFLIGHAHELITLHNWKGETWYVFLTNNPFEFSHAARWQPKGERVDITLEFEGVRT